MYKSNLLDVIAAKKLVGGGSGGGDKVLNSDGIIKQEHLPDGYPYDNRVFDFVMEEETIPYNADMNGFITQTVVNIVAGEEYTVNWNGVDYACTATEIENGMGLIHVLGNVGVMTGGEETGEPFVAMFFPPEQAEALGAPTAFNPFDGSTPITVSIRQTEGPIDTIDPKFLPEGYPYKKKARTILNESTAEPDEEGVFVFQIDHPIIAGRRYIFTENGETNTYTARSDGFWGAYVGDWYHRYGSGMVYNDSLTNIQSVTLSIVEAETVTPMWSGYLPFEVAYITQDAETGEYSCADMTYEEARRVLESGRFLAAYYRNPTDSGETTFFCPFNDVILHPTSIVLHPSYNTVSGASTLQWTADGITTYSPK